MSSRRPTGPSPLRVAMVAACPFPSLRGSQVLIRDLAQSLADRGHEVHLITYPEGESLAAVRGIRVHRARAWFAARRGQWGWRRVLLDFSLARTVYRVVKQAQIQVIHAHNYEAPLAGFLVRWLTGVPVVYHSHNALGDELAYYFAPGWRRRVAGFFGRVLDRHVPRRADFSIALTDELQCFLRRCGATEVATIPPGGGPVTTPTSPSDRTGRFAGRFVVMYTGNLDPYQDLEVLWAGFTKLRTTVPQSLLVVVTHESQWQTRAGSRLRDLVQAGAAQVIVAPTFAVVRRSMACADVLVSPRQSWSGYPIKLLNYMAAGRAVVAAAGSAKGIVDGCTGLVFRNADADGLAAALDRLAHDVPLRERLGEAARSAVKVAGTGSRDIEKLEAIYAQVCNRRPRSRSIVRSSEETGPRGLMAFPKDRISAASGE